MAAKFGDGVRRMINSVRWWCSQRQQLKELMKTSGEQAPRHLLATSYVVAWSSRQWLPQLGIQRPQTPVTMRDALAEAARLREENLKILQVMQWGQQQLSKTITQSARSRGHECGRSR
jgi:hypothetical protein